MKFISEMWHPNSDYYLYIKINYKTIVYPDGNVCISILHPPG